MTPEEQNIAIAKACGREWHKPTEQEMNSGSYYSYYPDFTRSLDEMHWAVMSMSNNDRDLVNLKLVEITEAHFDHSEVYNMDSCINATAAERAEAFLKAKGLWKE